VRFSKRCYGRKGASIEELNEMYKNEEVHPWYGVGDCLWKYVYKVDHEEREQQLAWYMRSYDKHEKASSIGRERMLGGKIETVFPRMSMPCVTVKAAIHWENYVNYINEKLAITWKKVLEASGHHKTTVKILVAGILVNRTREKTHQGLVRKTQT
jgi:hypothetical protein